MNYEYYRVFYFVGKHKNLTRAATELHSSQPAVSRTIQNLEAELNCKLFSRNKSGVEFTREGAKLFEYVSIAHSHLLKGENEINQKLNSESGTIHIGATVTALYGFLFDFLNVFHQAHPKIKYKIYTGSTNHTIERLRSGVVDLAFVSTPCNVPRGFDSKVLTEFKDILIAGNAFEELKNKEIDIEEIANYSFVCLRKGMQLREFVDAILSERNIDVTPDIEADGADLIIPMVSHNLGLGIVPQGMARDAIARKEVFEIKLRTEIPKRKICMIINKNHPHSGASRVMQRAVLSQIETKSK